ncbi:hypothetical protein Slala02_00060 [Streptomyces lavendulae subsp. lavendulae]|nr:hypothetical protein Slala01_63020 [Streptomyces lavendulae subsp. lavendulae]GLX24186.1 hypothetical protein Slala02_00060 [Streptomyces lavendulae subsp. lavendulae]
MYAVHTTGIRANARPAAPARPSCTGAVAGAAVSRADGNGWD